MKYVYRIRKGKLVQEAFRKECPCVYVPNTLIEKLVNLSGEVLERVNQDIMGMVNSEIPCQLVAVAIDNNHLTVCSEQEPNIQVPLKMVRKLRG